MAIEKSENQVVITSLKARFELNAMRDEDFPSIYSPDEELLKTFEPVVLSELIDKTLFSVSTDDAKQHLTGVFFFCKESTATAVSTDGHRLSLAEYGYEGEFRLPSGIIIPQKGAKEIKRLADDHPDRFKLAYLPDKKLLAVLAGSTVFTVRIIDSKFPPYEKVIPEYSENIMVAPNTLVADSLKRIRLISDGADSGVILSLSHDTLVRTGTDVSKGTAHEEIEVDYEGEDITIAFNINFFEQILSRIEGPEFKMAFGGKKAAALLTPVDSNAFVAVLMPLKLTD